MKNKFTYIKIPLIIINLIMSILLIIGIDKLDILPTKYFLLILSVLFLINGIIILFLSLKNMIFKILGILLTILLVLASVIGIMYVNETNEFLDTSFNNNIIETSTYNVIVLKESPITKIDELENQKIGYLKSTTEYINKLTDTLTIETIPSEDLFVLYESFLSKEINSIVIDEAYIGVLEEQYPDINEKIKIIYTFNHETILEKKEEVVEKIIRPINIYISGSDSRSENISNKSRSDVNMIVTINPYTHQILLTSIPRDYYVQVRGQTGLKDKLTHAGIYGLETSTGTIEDLFNIKIDYSIKVGMNAVTEIVDLVGGIEVYSDITFNSYHINGWVVKKGMNKMDGAHALAYARERYAYASGDRHRIQNQQQVLEAVLKKVMVDKSILIKYDELLTSLGNLYRTDIPREVITEYVKEQLDSMPTWTFETQWVDGKGASMNTHTAPSFKSYVMLPFEEDVTNATNKINEVLSNT